MRTATFRSLLGVSLSAVVLSLVAVFNGFPLVFDDTGSYLAEGIATVRNRWLSVSWAHPIFYSLFITPLHMVASLWAIVLVQSLIAAHVTWLTLRVVAGVSSPIALAGTAVFLALTTSLPWLTAQIMPDFFTAIVVLGLFLLAYGHHQLSRGETIYLIMLTAASVVVHLSHFPLAIGLAAVIWIMGRLCATKCDLAPITIWPVLTALTLAGAAQISSQYISRGEAVLSSHGQLFALSRFLADGPAREYLRENCDNADYALCAYLVDLETQSHPGHLLSHPESPLFRVGVNEIREEATAIVLGSLATYPMWHLRLAGDSWVRQLTTFSTGVWLESYADRPTKSVTRVIANEFPFAYEDYRSSKQNAGTLPIHTVAHISDFIVPAAALFSLAALFQLVRLRDLSAIPFAVVSLSAVLGNAFITGALSIVDARYQSRIVWLVVLLALVLAFRVTSKRPTK